MCRLFGFRSAVPSRAHHSLLSAENALALQSTAHPDGWGIGWITGDDAYVVKSANPAHACERFRRASARLTSHTFVVHVRRATVGHVDHLNAHPFRFGRWLFAHNGTLFGFEQLQAWMLERIHPAFQPLILGDTDSEHLFYYVLSALIDAGADRDGRGHSCASTAASALRGALAALDAQAVALGLERPITNVLVTDGEIFLGHRAGMPLLLSTQKRHCGEAETCPEPLKPCLEPVRPPGAAVNHLLLASERIATDQNLWEEVPEGTTVVLDQAFGLSFIEPPEGWTAPELPARYRSAS